MKAGDTFRSVNSAVDIHLWVIISDPRQDASQVLIVSLTTYEAKKESVCLLDVGDHPFVRHKTCVAYNLAKAPSLAQLEQARDAGHLIQDNPISASILLRIREGAALSKKLAVNYYVILEDQGLV